MEINKTSAAPRSAITNPRKISPERCRPSRSGSVRWMEPVSYRRKCFRWNSLSLRSTRACVDLEVDGWRKPWRRRGYAPPAPARFVRDSYRIPAAIRFHPPAAMRAEVLQDSVVYAKCNFEGQIMPPECNALLDPIVGATGVEKLEAHDVDPLILLTVHVMCCHDHAVHKKTASLETCSMHLRRSMRQSPLLKRVPASSQKFGEPGP